MKKIFKRKPVAIYAYTASKNQEDLQNQIYRIENELLKSNIKNIKIYAESGNAVSFSKGSRPMLDKLIHDCESGLIKDVYIKSVDRFGRDVLKTLRTLRILRENGIRVFLMNEKICVK